MENNNKELQRFHQFKLLMLDSLTKQQKQNHPLNQKLLQTIVLIHTLNIYFGLKPINQNDQIVQFDHNWAHGKQSVYKLRYKLTKNGKTQTVLFRLLDQNGELNVNFCIQGQSDLQTYSVKSSDTQKDIQQNHTNQLKKILPYRQEPQRGNQPLLRPVPLMRPINERDPPNYPMPLPKPDNLPFNSPFGKEEYVGPNSSIFSNGRNPGFQGSNPLGRYDPVDPFDYQGRVEPPDDFQGFDEFGNPILKPKIPKGPFIPGGNNPFNRQPPGFGGGGFGGGFGGFGPNNLF